MIIENIDILKEVQLELQRFQKKLDEAIEEQTNRKSYVYGLSNKKYASCKRGALDLKFELTKLTQDSKYKYDQYQRGSK